jgi:UDP-N-acetyl-D-mannosaminuronic acid dehydrogenase
MSESIARPLGIMEVPAPWTVRRIAVVGPGFIGMPTAALLAYARVRVGSEDPAHVVVVQRSAGSLGWQTDAINSGRSPIGGIEPGLESIIRTAVADGHLSATDDLTVLRQADVIFVCVSSDLAPDEGPLYDTLYAVSREVAHRSNGSAPLVIIESTLAPTALQNEVRDVFRAAGLEEGRDVHLGYSPHRVMPGRLMERVSSSDRLVAGLTAETTLRMAEVYKQVVTRGTLHRTNPLTAELVKTLENAYRDVRIALAAEVARYCDQQDIDFYKLREWLNGELLQRDVASFQPTAVPRGALLVPTLGVGGHALPRDGRLLWARARELSASADDSLILEARRINDESPLVVQALVQRMLGGLEKRSICLLGTAYKSNSDDTTSSPTLVLARALLAAGARVALHDPYVRVAAVADDQQAAPVESTTDLEKALAGAELAVVCVAHRDYVEGVGSILLAGRQMRVLVDAANAFQRRVFEDSGVVYAGIGRGTRHPPTDLCRIVYDAFRVIERGLASEVASLIAILNSAYTAHDIAHARFEAVQQLVGTCPTGCAIADPGPAAPALDHGDFASRLVTKALAATARTQAAQRRSPPSTSRAHVRLSDH